MPLSRRELMRGAALLGSLSSVAGTFGAGAARADTPVGSSPALTSADYFDLSTVTTTSFQTSGPQIGLRTSQTHFQVQGLAINSATNQFFIAQAPDPVRPKLRMTMNGTSWTADGYNQHASGDLVISRFDLATYRLRDSMYFMGAGHGGQIGIEPSSPLAYLWAEVYPGNPKQTSGTTSSQVWGTHLARLPYAAGRLMTNTQVVPHRYSSTPYIVERYGPVAGAHQFNAAIDTSSAYGESATGVLVVRYRLGGDPSGSPRRFTAFDLDAASRGDFSAPLATTTEPIEIMEGGGHSEGYATCGQYIYLVATDGSGNPWLYQVDFNGVPGTYMTKVALPGSGEPESVALLAPNRSPARLYYLTAGVHHPRTFDLFFLGTTA